MNVNALQPEAVRPPDLEIRVTTPWGSRHGQQLQYILNSPSGAVAFTHHPIPGPPIHDPEAFCERLFREIEGFHSGQDPTGSQVFDVGQDVTAIGKNLFQELLPQEIQLLYPKLRQQAQTLVIVSDEAWIPWEMLHPPTHLGGDFLCLEFQVSRWLTGPVSYAARLPLRSAAVMATAGTTALPHGQDEVEEIQRKLEVHPDIRLKAALEPTWVEFRDLVHQNDLDLIHVSGHGRFDASLKESVLQVDRQSFRTLHLGENTTDTEVAHSPFVCFNVCQLGRVAESIAQVEGWPARWIRQRRCGGFVGPMWKIRDEPAAEFADIFYRHVLSGVPLARALQATRLALRERSVSPLNWLAYSLYGHPNAQLMPGRNVHPAATSADPTGAQSVSSSWDAPHPPRRTGTAFQPASANRRDSSPLRSSPRTSTTPERALTRHPTARSSPTGRSTRRVGTRGILLGGLGMALAVLLWFRPGLPGPPLPVDQQTHGTPTLTHDPSPRDEVPTTDTSSRPVVVPPAEDDDTTEDHSDRPPPPPQSQPVASPHERSKPPPSRPPFEVAVTQPGKLALVVLDTASQTQDMQVGRAIETLLIQENVPATPYVPGIEPKAGSNLISDVTRNLALDGKTPWGAEYVLMVSSETSSLPDSAPFKSLSLSIQAQLIHARTGESLVRTAATHTGRGISTDQALAQASKRCLRQVLTYLKEKPK